MKDFLCNVAFICAFITAVVIWPAITFILGSLGHEIAAVVWFIVYPAVAASTAMALEDKQAKR